MPEWVRTYCIGLLLDEEPPEKGNEILLEMERAINDSRPYMIMIGRGNGKTSYIECTTVFAIATNKRRFPVIVSSNEKSAQIILNDIFRMFTEPDTIFA